MDALYNPFGVVRGAKALGLGAIVLVVLAGVSMGAGVHLDGALDVHFGRPPSASEIIVETLVDWLSLAGGFWLMAKILRLRPRTADLFAMTAVARAPNILVAALSGRWVLGKYMPQIAEMETGGTIRIHPHAAMQPIVILVTLLSLVMIVWEVTLLVFAFKETTGARGGKAALGIGGALIAAEIASKLVLTFALR
ncbi:MAG: hypothetical protein ACLP1X_21245 [Polyangiaceae bacterium]|jgi:hypothetical protein